MGGGDRAGRSRGRRSTVSGPQTQRRRQVLRRGRPSLAPKSPLTPSLRACPEGLPTWSRPEGLDRGLALAGRPAVPRSRRPASRPPARPKAPRLPTSTTEAAWPFRLRSFPEGSGSPARASSARRLPTPRDLLPCGCPSRDWILLRSPPSGNKKLCRIFEISVDNQRVSEQMPEIFSTVQRGCRAFPRIRVVDKVIPKKFASGRKQRRRTRRTAGRQGPSGPSHAGPAHPVRFTRRARRADGAGCALRVRGKTAFRPRPARRSRRSDTGWDCPRR